MLTHDPKFDVPVLEVALRSAAGYIGVMGSRRTHDDRMNRLREVGLTDVELSRLPDKYRVPVVLCGRNDALQRALEADGVRSTQRDQAYIFRNISPPKLMAVLMLLEGKTGLAAILSSEAVR